MASQVLEDVVCSYDQSVALTDQISIEPCIQSDDLTALERARCKGWFRSNVAVLARGEDEETGEE